MDDISFASKEIQGKRKWAMGRAAGRIQKQKGQGHIQRNENKEKKF